MSEKEAGIEVEGTVREELAGGNYRVELDNKHSVLAYASDYSLLEPVIRRHGLSWTDPRLRVASLDHSMWFHRPVRAHEWLP